MSTCQQKSYYQNVRQILTQKQEKLCHLKFFGRVIFKEIALKRMLDQVSDVSGWTLIHMGEGNGRGLNHIELGNELQLIQ